MSGVERPEIAGYVELNLTFKQLRKGGQTWIGHCLETESFSHAKSLDETRKALISMTSLLLSTVDNLKQREHFFEQHRIIFHPGLPEISKQELLYLVNIPGQEQSWIPYETISPSSG